MRYTNVRTNIQSALDGAALAAALPANKSDSERVAIAKDYFESNVSPEWLPAGLMNDLSIKVTLDSVEATVDTRIDTAIMQIAGLKSMRVTETAEVMRPFEGSAEISLVLDYSGSMNSKNKYRDMRDAAKTMITNLDAAVEDGKLKVGLVPFSAMVHTEMNRDYVNQTSSNQTWSGCTQDRRYPYNTTVDTPTSDSATRWGYVDNNGENNGNYGCAAYQNKGLKIVPLTANLENLKSKLDDMRPLGNTNIALGAEFGWNLLDPQLPYDEGLSYSNANNRKFLVLLTDGVQTSGEFGEDNSRSPQQANANLLELCDNMRSAGVTVFAIAYDVNDPAVTDLLKKCAPERYFEPDAGGTEIKQVFSQVSRQIRNQVARLSR